MSEVTVGPGGTTAPLADFADAQAWQAGTEILRGFTDPTAQTELMWAATMKIEDRCDRRLAPFTGLVESYRAEGVDQDVLGSADLPMNLQTALGWSQSIAFASTDLVRDFWLKEYAPVRAESWSYNITQIRLLLAYGDIMVVPQGNWQGPENDSGWVRFTLGTFCPVGTMIEVTYDGGYSQVPYGLKVATILEAFKTAVVSAEPEARKDLSLAELDAEILSYIAPYIRSGSSDA